MSSYRQIPIGYSDPLILNRKNPISRNLTSLAFGGRPFAYALSVLIGSIGTYRGFFAHGNAAAWPSNQIAYDSKYGYASKVLDTRADGSSGGIDYSWTAVQEHLNVPSLGATIMYIGTVNTASTTSPIEYSLVNYGGSGDSGANRFLLLNNTGGVRNKISTRVLNRSNLSYLNSPSVDFPTGRVVCIIATHQRAQGQRIYIDGKLVTSQDTTVNVDIQRYTGAGNAVSVRGNGGSNDGTYIVGTWSRALDPIEIQSLFENPHQLLSNNLISSRLLNTHIPDFTAQFAPPSTIRSTYLTTASKYDSNNQITNKLLFASSPAHNNTDGVNPNTTWTNSSTIQVVPGRGGLAWVYGRAQNSSSTGLTKQLSNTNWSMLSVFSAEVNHLSEITPGHYLAGPSFGSSSVPRLLVYNNGRIGLVTLNNSIDVDTVTITPRRVNTVAVTSDGNFTRFYLNGKLVYTSSTVFNSGGSVTYQPQRIFTTDSVAGTGLRPWYIYLSALWERPLLEHEVAKLSQDPFQLFKRPDTTNHKILAGQYKYVETDANGRWIPYNEQPAYVNHSDLPRNYIPVNKAHPLANKMVFCTTPAHGLRDAYDQDLIWVNPTDNTNSYYNQDFLLDYTHGNYRQYGKAWGAYSIFSTKRTPSANKYAINFNSTGLTLTAFVYINQDTYPLTNRLFNDIGQYGVGRYLFHGGFTSQWGFFLRGDGRLGYGIVNSGPVEPRGGSNKIVPLKKLVALSVSILPGKQARFFVDGQFIGSWDGNWGGNNLIAGPYIGFNYSNGNYSHPTLYFYLAACWQRVLSDSEIAEFSQHPGQIFKGYDKFTKLYGEAATAEQFFNKFLLFFG